MSTLNVPDPAQTHTFVVRIQVSEGAPSVSVMLPDSSGLWPASFGPEEFSGPEQTANQAALALLLSKAKARWEAGAVENGNTINWVAP